MTPAPDATSELRAALSRPFPVRVIRRSAGSLSAPNAIARALVLAAALLAGGAALWLAANVNWQWIGR